VSYVDHVRSLNDHNVFSIMATVHEEYSTSQYGIQFELLTAAQEVRN
jgi:hypothetical protein